MRSKLQVAFLMKFIAENFIHLVLDRYNCNILDRYYHFLVNFFMDQKSSFIIKVHR